MARVAPVGAAIEPSILGERAMNAIRILTSAKGLRAFAPYLLAELLLPGGTLVALVMWLSQRLRQRRRAGALSAFTAASMAAVTIPPLATPTPVADR